MNIKLYQTDSHPCSYLDDQEARTLFVDPKLTVNPSLFKHLSELGFRRSGKFIYRPNCEACSACISIRLLTQQFQPNRSQRRILKKNADLKVIASTPHFSEPVYTLYERYIEARHQDGDMYPPTKEQYVEFLVDSPSDSHYYHFLLDDKLVGVCVADQLEDGLSAVYSFFDPDYAGRSLGRYMLMWLVQQASALGLPYLYLGYWVEGCRKMNYKSEYQPAEILRDEQWQLLRRDKISS